MVKIYQFRTNKEGLLEIRPRFKNKKHKGYCKGAFGGGKTIRQRIKEKQKNE